MRQEHRSPAYTTQWADLPRVVTLTGLPENGSKSLPPKAGFVLWWHA
ncbi:DUF4113 domain-containing protein [Microbulbifer sp. JTAC008]